MKTLNKTLPNDIEQLKALLLNERRLAGEKEAILKEKERLIKEQQTELKTLQEKHHHLLEQFRLAQHRQFGKSSETNVAQGDLFNEVEQLADEASEPEKEQLSYTRVKPKRKPLPKDLPREVIVHDIDEADKICDGCGGTRHKIGEDKSEQLEFVPAQIKVIEHVRPKYGCRTCDQSGTQVSIKVAPRPTSPIPKSIATPSLLSQIITSKYQYSLPLYRQESLFKQHGIELSRQTMSDWMLKCAELFTPLIDDWHEIMLQQPVIQADETTVNVLSEDKAKCYMWVYCTGSDSPVAGDMPNIVLFDYQNSRAGKHAAEFLSGFVGYLQVDGYSGYEQLQAELVACWAHARRKFVEAHKVQAKNKTSKANWAISHIKKLYRIETLLKGKAIEQKYNKRQVEALPLLKEFKAWLDKSSLQVPPQSAIGKAIAYSLNLWDKLIRYIDDGRLNIDNNRAERAVKPFVIGRKNWLFSNTTRGAKASAVLYSVIETARANGLMPIDYITYLLTELPKKPDDLEVLMPWNVKLG